MYVLSFRRHEIAFTLLPPIETVSGSYFVRPSACTKASPTGQIYLKSDTED